MTDLLIKELEQMGKHPSVRLNTDRQVWKEAAALLRRQHEAIKVLRGALGEIAKTPWVDAALDPQRPRLIAKQTLADTEEICKTTSQ